MSRRFERPFELDCDRIVDVVAVSPRHLILLRAIAVSSARA